MEGTLVDVGLPSGIISVIMHYLSSSCMQILWNGELLKNYVPTQGIRQADPFFPYV